MSNLESRIAAAASIITILFVPATWLGASLVLLTIGSQLGIIHLNKGG